MTHPLVKKYNLTPHPEGGFYRQVFRSENETKSFVHNASRPALTHIYFLLQKMGNKEGQYYLAQMYFQGWGRPLIMKKAGSG